MGIKQIYYLSTIFVRCHEAINGLIHEEYLNSVIDVSFMNLPQLNVIFPMAGDGIRFGGTFKPFLNVTGQKFIELAKMLFDIFK